MVYPIPFGDQCSVAEGGQAGIGAEAILATLNNLSIFAVLVWVSAVWAICGYHSVFFLSLFDFLDLSISQIGAFVKACARILR